MPVKLGQISGLLNINKPKGITSHDVVNRIRRLAHQRKVGHAGTLDPLATGVLLVCLGQATRLIEYLMGGRKQYRAIIHFGISTDTLDADGNVVAEADATHLTEADLRQVLPTFQGEIDQIPPIFSALKQGGQPLYKLARAGKTVTLQPRRVKIYSMGWVAWQPPELTLDVVCSPGTYIRSLARDLGEAVGTAAHLAELTRLASGDWSLPEAVPLAVLEQAVARDTAAWQQYLHPPDRAVAHLPQVTLDETEVRQVKQGQRIKIDAASPLAGGEDSLVRAYTATGDFLAILTQDEAGDKLWQPKKVFQIPTN